MASIDTYKHAVPGGKDIPGLGNQEELRPLPFREIRNQLSFARDGCLKTERRAVILLLKRLADYYSVIGYAGPLLANRGTCEVGRVYGQWFEEWECGRDYSRREVILTTNARSWQCTEEVFNRARFMCAEAALRLACWEISKEVPESEIVLYKTIWPALRTLQNYELTGVSWRSKRGRWGTAGFRKHLATTLAKIETAEYSSGIHHGRFVPNDG